MDYGYYLKRAARLFGDNVAVRASDSTTGRTYAEVDERADGLAAFLVSRGVAVGDRVADVQWNRPEVLDIDFGVARSGGVRVPLNARASTVELIQVLEIAQPKVLIIGPEFADIVPELRAAVSSVEHVIGCSGSQCTPYEEAIAEGWASLQAGTCTLPSISIDDTLSLKFTGGSTGVPKGTVRTHRAQEAIALNILLDLYAFQEDDCLLQIQPMSHGGGAFVLTSVIRGAMQLTMARFDAGKVVELINQGVITSIKLVPTMLLRILEQIPASGELSSESRLRGIIYGAAPMPGEPLRRAMSIFGPILIQTYGQTEAPITITALSAEQHRLAVEDQTDRLSSAGKPYATVSVEIRDLDGRALPRGERGEICVKGPMTMERYWNNDNPGIDPDGWVHTGDIGIMDADGYVYLLDRLNDMIITGGFNVYPREVEEVIYDIPGVKQAVVLGMQHADWGESVVAVVVPHDNTVLHAAALSAFISARLSKYKVPKTFVITDGLPETATGKVTRRGVRDALLESLGEFPHDDAEVLWTRTLESERS